MNSKNYLIILSFFMFGLSYSEEINNSEDVIKEYIKHADTYYWFGMAESGNVESLRKGIDYLDLATQLLENSIDIDENEINSLLNEINALKTDLNGQIELSYDTFYGVFPIIRLMNESILNDPSAMGTYELVDDPVVIASTAAMKNMAMEITGKWGREPQLDVVFTSIPNNPDLENEALYIFNTSTKYFVHNKREVVSVLNAQELESFEQGIMTTQMKNKLINSYNSSTLIMAVVEELDTVDDDYFYLAKAYAYNGSTDSEIRSLYVMGFCRDRTSSFYSIALVNFILLIFALLFYNYMHPIDLSDSNRKLSTIKFSKSNITVSVIYFISGKCMPLLFVPFASLLKPTPETLAITSFWWPPLLGIIMLAGPVILLKVISVRLGKLSEFFMSRGKGAASAIAISIGVCSYFSELFIIKPIDNLILSIVFLIMAAISCAFIFGLSLDEREDSVSPNYVFASFFGFGFLGLTVCTGNYLFIMLSATISFLSLLIVLYQNKLLFIKEDTNNKSSKDSENNLNSDTSDISSKIIKHKYIQFDFIEEQIKPAIELFKSGQSTIISIDGDSGVGKTAAAQEIIDRITSKRKSENVKLLEGVCETPINDNIEDQEAYGPFKVALAGYFKINLLASDNTKYQQIESAMSSIYNTVMPIAGVFLPPMTPEENRASSDREIKIAISNTFNELLKEKDIVLFIDDYQWIDKRSKELLDSLFEEFILNNDSTEDKKNIIFILTSRNHTELNTKLEGKITTVKIEKPNINQCKKILIESLNIESKTSDKILNRIGDLSDNDIRGQLFWLFQVVSHISQQNLFEVDKSGQFRIKKGTGEIPVPNDMKENISIQFKAHPEYKPILECAACLGMEFPATILSDSLDMNRMELLRLLKEIESETSMIYDVKESDDLFKFQSSLVLEVIREQMSISGKGPNATDVPQIVREYHSQVALALEKKIDSVQGELFNIANHYFAAGSKYAEKGFDYSLKAAHASSSMYDFVKAECYLNNAKICLKFSNNDESVFNENSIIIQSHKAHITGKGEEKVAQMGWEYIEKNISEDDYINKLSFLLKVIEASYNVGKPLWFTRTIKLCDKILKYAKMDSIEYAEAIHFKALSTNPSNIEGRLSLLNECYDKVNKIPDDIKRNRLLGKVITSYGSEMTKGANPKELKEDGLEMLQSRFEFDEKNNINDLKGQAITLGAIGRHYHYNTDNIKLAMKYFQDDLNICEEIEDVEGASMMTSFLAQCYLKKNDYINAINYYKKSYNFSKNMDDSGLVNIIFSHKGFLDTSLKLNKEDQNKQEIEEWGSRLLDSIESLGKQTIISVDDLNNWKKVFKGNWLTKLEKIIK